MTSPTSSFTVSAVSSNNTFIAALLTGMKWGGAAGTGTNITFSFPWLNGASATFAGPNGSAYSSYNEPTATQHFGLSALQQTAAIQALTAWSNVANINFTQIAETSTSVGDIRFAFSSASSLSKWWGYAGTPNSYWPSAGDIWINATYGPTTDWSPGDYNYEALMHEIGHAIGLKHPFDNTPNLSSTYDNRRYTIMSYTDPSDNIWPQGGFVNGVWVWTSYYINPETPMVLDIQAVQFLYGANYSYMSGNNTYTIDATKPFFKSIWDGGGTDTLSAANFSTNCIINLTPGSYSSFKFVAPTSNTGGVQATYDGTNNLGIAYGCIIENAIGGIGNDSITGNDANNNLIGGDGSDTLNGGIGNDTISGGSGNDVIQGGAGSDIAVFSLARSNYTIVYAAGVFTVTGSEGTDVISGVEYFQFSDQTVNALSYTDTIAPTVNSFLPADGSASISTSTNITLIFSESVQRGTGFISLRPGSATAAAVETYDAATSTRITISGDTVTIDPVNNLSGGTQYFVTFEAGTLVDLAGNQYIGTTSYDFTTASIVDTTAPLASSFSPADGATGVAVSSNIVITFNEAIQRGSGLIYLRPGSATATPLETFDIATSTRISISGGILTIDPINNLANGVQYYVTLGSGVIKDMAGNSFIGTTTYDFTTVASPTGPINGTSSADNLVGTANNDTVYGLGGNDTITGLAGLDSMDGGDGSDIYLITASSEHSAAEIRDSGTVGSDEIRFTATSASTLILFAGDTGLESVVIGTGTGAIATTTGTTALNIDATLVLNGLWMTGNDGNNKLTGTGLTDYVFGNGGNDTLIGNAGNDYLYGGNGNDSLTGGAGNDSFVFDSNPNASTNRDILVDFTKGQDIIWLWKNVFTAFSGFAVGSSILPGQFWSGSNVKTAHDADDRIIYDSKTGIIYYDADGIGTAYAAVPFAVIGSSTKPALTYSDFYVF